MEQKLNTSGRIYELDILRTLACCAVVMLHASVPYACSDVGSLNFFIGNLWDSLSRFAVPVFVMISGALLLDEEHIYSAAKKQAAHPSYGTLFRVLVAGVLHRLSVDSSGAEARAV